MDYFHGDTKFQVGEDSINSNKRFIYISYDGAESAIFYSQVLGLVSQLKHHGVCQDLIVFNPVIQSLRVFSISKEAKRRAKILVNGTVTFLPRAGLYISPLIMLPFFLKDFLHRRHVVIHARGYRSTFISLLLKRVMKKHVKVIFDARGLLAEEFILQRGETEDNPIYRKLKKLEKIVVEHSDFILCVSEAFKRYLHETYNYPNTKIMVVPCCLDRTTFQCNPNMRERMRVKLNLQDKLVIVYCGSMHKWQLAEKMIQIFKLFKKMENI